MDSKARGLFIAASAVAVVLGIALGLFVRPGGLGPRPAPSTDPGSQTIATVFNTPRALPAFALTDARATATTAADLAGRRTWLFFGFTACPDVCPATLSIIASAVQKLPTDQRPAVYMVSVDPERDTPERLASYVTHFDADFNALTGELAQVQALADGLYATFAKVPLDSGGYTMDHFAGIYFLDEQGRAVAVSTSPHRPDQLAADYRAIHAL